MDTIRSIEAIDLFCGIGGLSYGLKKSGIQIKAGLDFDASCKKTYEKNTGATFINADISQYNLKQLQKFYSKNCTDKVLVGCAPCQPFSSHSHKKQNTKDKRWNLIDYFTQAVKELKPDVISMENVRGLTKAEIFSKFISDLKQLGYTLNYKVIFCPDYGIPQNRYRLVLLGTRNGSIDLPSKTHTIQNYKTVKDVIGKLNPIKAGQADAQDNVHKSPNLSTINIKRIKQSTPGGTWKDWDKKLLPDCYKKDSGQSYGSVYGRMQWNKPAPTITTQFYNYGTGRFGHPEQNRALSVREGALLQTFPKNYCFGEVTSISNLAKHIGNAVPPRLGEVIGEDQFINI